MLQVMCMCINDAVLPFVEQVLVFYVAFLAKESVYQDNVCVHNQICRESVPTLPPPLALPPPLDLVMIVILLEGRPNKKPNFKNLYRRISNKDPQNLVSYLAILPVL